MVRLVTRVLLVDDDIELLDIARILLNQKDPDLEIVISSSVKEALEKLEKEEFDIIISDYMMPDSSGLAGYFRTWARIPCIGNGGRGGHDRAGGTHPPYTQGRQRG